MSTLDGVDPIPWPTDLLTFFAEHGSWTEALEPNIVDFPVEVGQAKRRRRSYLPSARKQFQRIISTADLQTFIDFYEGDLNSGVFNFTAVDPRTGDTTEYQFLQSPAWRDVSPGYWRLQFALRAVNLPVAVAVAGGNDQYTKVLLHFEGSPGDDDVTDSNAGGSAHLWVPSGDFEITPYGRFNSGGLFGGVNGFATMAANTDLVLGSVNWTVDHWFKCIAAGGSQESMIGQCDSAANAASVSFLVRRFTDNKIYASANVGASAFLLTSTTLFTDTANPGFHHLEFSRKGTTLRLFLDGVLEASATMAGTVNASPNNLSIGRLGEENGFYFNGTLDEVRLSVGIARHDANFTPPTRPYTP